MGTRLCFVTRRPRMQWSPSLLVDSPSETLTSYLT